MIKEALSQLAGDMLNPAEAVAVAEASIRLRRPQSRIGAVAAAYASHGYGLAGDRAACDRLCGTARDALDDAGGTGLPWAKFFDGPYIDVHHARSLAALGEYRAAAERFRAAIDDLHPDYHRDRACTWPVKRPPMRAPGKPTTPPGSAFRPSRSARKHGPGASSPNWPPSRAGSPGPPK